MRQRTRPVHASLTSSTFQQRRARDDAKQALTTPIAVLRRAAETLEDFRRQLDETTDDETRSRILNNALHHLAANVLGNLRLDLIATAQAQLALAHEEALKKESK